MAEEMKKQSSAGSILANDTTPKSAKTAGAGVPKEKTAAHKMEHHADGGEK